MKCELLGRKSWAVLLMALFSLPLSAQDDEVSSDFQLELQFENRYFFNEGLYTGHEMNYLSIAAKPEFQLSWKDGDHNLKVSLFGRLDQHDNHRTHADIRELYYQRVKGNWELSLGWKTVSYTHLTLPTICSV